MVTQIGMLHFLLLTLIVVGAFSVDPLTGNHALEGAAMEEAAQHCGDVCTLSPDRVVCEGPNVTEIPSDCPANINSIIFKNTGVRTIPDGAFDKYTSLTVIAFTGNAIQSITKGAFRGLLNLETLYLIGNELTGMSSTDEPFEDLSSLKEVMMDHNKFTIFPLHRFANAHSLVKFNVKRNQISDMGPKINFALQNLREINLYSNNLTSVNASVFQQIPNIANLHLGSNKISVIDNGRAFMDMPSLQKLDIGDNPLHCDCQALWMLEAKEAGANWTMAWDTGAPRCGTPPWMKFEDISDLYPRDLTCEPPVITPITSTNITRTSNTPLTLTATMDSGLPYSTWLAPDGKSANDMGRGLPVAKSDIKYAYVDDTIDNTNLSSVVTTLHILGYYEMTGLVNFTLVATNAWGSSSITFLVSGANGGPPVCTASLLLLLIYAVVGTEWQR